MSRLPRFCPPGLPQHIIQRGNNRSVCFAADQDFATYASWLSEYADQFVVDIHAWVFMTNHVHLLVTPTSSDGVSKMMQALGRRYVRYFNRRYFRSGTLWEGRFKSCVIQSERYLLQCYRYIELNPVRAGMVSKPSEYVWSSYRVNALGVGSNMCTPHPEYLKLGSTLGARLSAYHALFEKPLSENSLDSIRKASKSGLAVGSDRFKAEIEALYERRVTPAVMGRPRRSGQFGMSDLTLLK